VDRAGDVLNLVRAHIGKANRKFFADMFAHRCADTDFAGLGQRL
jgi:hypothetical protein